MATGAQSLAEVTTLARYAEQLLDCPVIRSSRLAGGDLSEVAGLELADGRAVVVKGGPAPRTEARMLAAIRASGAPAPRVLAVDDSVLVLEWLAGGDSPDTAWPDLGTVLRRLHTVRGAAYGYDDDYAFGRLAIENSPRDTWPQFWGERRLANRIAALPRATAARVERLVRDIANRLPDRPPPALLHGDLWAGNILAADGRITGLIDPACYYGHCEVDFAMLALFGRTGPALFDAYGPLEPGHEERQPIYQLWPALVHYRLFGSAYLGMVERMLARAGV